MGNFSPVGKILHKFKLKPTLSWNVFGKKKLFKPYDESNYLYKFMNLCNTTPDVKWCAGTHFVVFWDDHFILPNKHTHYRFDFHSRITVLILIHCPKVFRHTAVTSLATRFVFVCTLAPLISICSLMMCIHMSTCVCVRVCVCAYVFVCVCVCLYVCHCP